MLPSTLPICPLPNVVLFPNVFLPLHIFEPRYRELVRYSLQGDRLIGMALLRPGWQQDYEGRPAVYPIGCAGLITHSEPLADGRFNIVLRGLEKFQIMEEEEEGRHSFRIATIDPIIERLDDAERSLVKEERRRLEALLVPRLDRTHDLRVPESMADEDLVNALAQYLELEPVEKQALLERSGLLQRCQSLIELLKMKVLVARHHGSSGGLH